MTRVAVDEVDRRLIRALQDDGRVSYADLAEVAGLSAPAVRQRVQRLQDTGVLQIVAVCDPLKLGLPVTALVGIKVDGDARAVADAIGAIAQVVYVVLTAGGYDLFAEVVCHDLDELFAVINDRIRGLPQVVATESFVHFDIHTHRFSWDVPD